MSVTVWLEELGSRGATFHYEVDRADTRLASGRTRHVWVRAEDSRPCRMPDMARSYFETLAGAIPTVGST